MKEKILTSAVKTFKWKSVFVRHLVLLFSIIFLFSMTFILVFFSYYKYNTKKAFMSYANNNLESISASVDDVFSAATNSFSSISANQTVTAYLSSKEYSDNNQLAHDVNIITELLHNSLYSSPYIDSIYLYNPLNDYVLSTNSSNYRSMFYDRTWYDLYTKNNNSDYILTRTIQKSSGITDCITICRNIYSGTYVDGVVIININLREMLGTLLGSHDYISYISLSDGDGNNVFSSGEDITDCIIISSKLDTVNYKITAHIPSDITNVPSYMYWYLLLVGVMALLISLLLSYYLSYRSYSSILSIANILNENMLLPTNEVQKESENEIQYIYDLLTQFIHNSESTNLMLIKKMLLLKQYQFTALQDQINPHFLLNTLNLINLLDITEHHKETKISNIVSLLCEILRSVLNTKDFLITMENEISLLQKYIALQNIKYGNKFNMICDIPDDIMQCTVIKFMLQPIVENALIHGILPSPTKSGTIKITAVSNSDTIRLTVSNDGNIISDDAEKQLNERLKSEEFPSNSHIGLTNVNQRIKIIFGDEFGCNISHTMTETQVRITIPKTGL
ncbi:MAG: histidine kinase [Clostridia bacterium]|nr:histidine kinase [Clostridia bacterium]